MAAGNLYQLRFRETFLNKNIDSVWFYIQETAIGGGNMAAQLAFEWFDNFGARYAQLQCEACNFQYVDVINLSDFEEAYRYDVTGEEPNNGTDPGTPAQDWDAFVFTKRPLNRQYKVGLARVRGLSEFAWTSPGVNPDYLAGIELFRAEAENSVITPSAGTFRPIILRRQRVPADISEPFIEWNYSFTEVAGVVFNGYGHKVKN